MATGGARVYAELSQWETWKESQDGLSPTPAKVEPVKHAMPALSAEEAKELRGLESRIRAADEKTAHARLALEDPSIATDAAELHKRQQAQRRAVADAAGVLPENVAWINALENLGVRELRREVSSLLEG